MRFSLRNTVHSVTMQRCAWCNKQAPVKELHQCSAGKEVQYCNKTCQRAHWKQSHKLVCKAACKHGHKCSCTTVAESTAEAKAGIESLQDKARQLLQTQFRVESYKTEYPNLKARFSREKLDLDNLGLNACLLTYESALANVNAGTIKGHRGALITVWDENVTTCRLSGSKYLGVEISFMYEKDIKSFTDEHTTVRSVLASFNPNREILTGAVVKTDEATKFCLTTFTF